MDRHPDNGGTDKGQYQGEFIDPHVSGEMAVIVNRDLEARVEELEEVVKTLARKAHATYHKGVVKGASEGDWTTCRMVTCKLAQDALVGALIGEVSHGDKS